MRHFVDGNQLCVTKDDFVNLMESPAVFIPLDDARAQTIQKDGLLALPVGDLMNLMASLVAQLGGTTTC